ncbi:MAG: alpha/beta fold hydrolase [Candidatus Lokiarchaeota archaeon]|nr:alpha/beta fold hydrolase [Candidatus Lokiarchaeota archaeon]MBD3339088.1 alpha/beta fold hydrolase [Candidatus Lokiarchaeota archaeon]
MFIDDQRVSNVVFYPRKAEIPSKLNSNITPLNFQIEKDITIGGYYFRNQEELPNVLMFHGNGEIALDYTHFYDLFLDCDLNLAVVDYRGYGHSTGSPYYTSLIEDAMPIYQKFVEWLEENDLDTSPFLIGRSLGSVCASEIGAQNPDNLKGVVFSSGFGSIYNMMTRLFRIRGPEVSEEKLKKFSNDTRIQKFEKPVLVIHGTRDWIIPKEEALIIYEAVPDDIDKELIYIEGAGHNDIFGYKEEHFSPIKEFVQKHN